MSCLGSASAASRASAKLAAASNEGTATPRLTRETGRPGPFTGEGAPYQLISATQRPASLTPIHDPPVLRHVDGAARPGLGGADALVVLQQQATADDLERIGFDFE